MPTFGDLKSTYEHARVNGHKEFMFNGRTFVIEYAKYLIDYFEMHGATQNSNVRFVDEEWGIVE